jgi:FdhE protein
MDNETPSCEAAAIARRLEALIGREDASEDYVRFRIELLKAQAAVRQALARSASPPPPSGVAVAESEAGNPPLGPDDIPFDRALLGSLVRDLAAALQRRGRRSEDVTHLFAAMAKDPALLETLARRAAFGPDEAFLTSLARRLRVSPEDLLFLGRALAAPFVREAVCRLKKRVRVTAPEGLGRCPYCGSSPGLAKLRREEGRRILFCSLCGEGWEFARVACPLCGRGRALGMLSIGADPRWIETCEECKGYLKTTDERELPEGEVIVPLVEATMTLYLDLIAEKEGYARGLPYAALR